MRAISWNVNSLRTRFERVVAVLDRHRPDLLCLQETKVQDDDFPHQAFTELGYVSHAHGQKTYNGVALIGKEGIEDVVHGFPGDPCPEQARVISCTMGGVRWINVYVLNGKEVGCDKFELKMAWLTALRAWIADCCSPEEAVVVLGDFNIAPDDRDVHDPDKWRGKIHFSPQEHAQLQGFRDWGFTDLYRLQHAQGGLYSWWDYRGGGFERDHGLRIDLALGTPPARARCTGTHLDREERAPGEDGDKPSDHVPLLVDVE